MTPAELSLIANLIQSGSKIGLAAWQNNKANKIDTTRPEMPIPQAQLDAISLYKTMMGQDMPGLDETRGAIDQSLARTSRKVTGVGSTSSEMLAAIVGAGSNVNESLLTLGGQNATYKAGMVDNLARELDSLAAYENKSWEWNDKNRFEENTAAKGALGNAAINNASNGLNDVMGTILLNKIIQDFEKKNKTAGQIATEATAVDPGAAKVTNNDVSLFNTAMTPNPLAMDYEKMLGSLPPQQQSYLGSISTGPQVIAEIMTKYPELFK